MPAVAVTSNWFSTISTQSFVRSRPSRSTAYGPTGCSARSSSRSILWVPETVSWLVRLHVCIR
jgi:hypothetical protein